MANSSSANKKWTTRDLLHWTTQYFEKKGIDHPRLSTEMLLAHVLETERLKLYMEPERPASELERAAFRDLVERAVNHEPVDYLVGQTPFFSMMFKVSPAVLVPRPSTETLVEHVIQHARRTPGFASPDIFDLGTGSGAIAISLCRSIDKANVTASDISQASLEIAQENANTLLKPAQRDRLAFKHGNLFEPVTGQKFRYIVSNPPYISDAEWAEVEPNVKEYEPESALRGGADGLDVVRRVISEARGHLLKPGHLAVEIAASQKAHAIALANEAGFENVQVLTDHENLPRVLVADLD